MQYYGRVANDECFHSNYGQARCFYNLLHKQDLHLLLKYLACRSETAPVRRTIKVVQKFIIHAIVSHVPLASCVSWCQVQSTPDNSNPRSLEPRANSNQNRLPLDFRHKFIVILPSVTRTLDNSNSL